MAFLSQNEDPGSRKNFRGSSCFVKKTGKIFVGSKSMCNFAPRF